MRAKASRRFAWPFEPRNMATEPITGDERARLSASAGERRRKGNSPSSTPAGIATTRSGAAPAPTTSPRIASPLVMTRSASQV